MKRKNLVLIILAVLLVATVILIYIINSNGKQPSVSNSYQLQPVKTEQNSLNIMVDPRIELLSSVQLNSSYQILTALDFNYKDDMTKYFASYKESSAVSDFRAMSQNDFIYDAPVAAMLYYSNPTEMKKELEVDNSYISRAGGETSLENFIKNLNSYSLASNFAKFYNDHSGFYNAIVEETAEKIKDCEIVSGLEGYYGIKKHSYNLILAPMFINGGYGPRIERADGTYDIYGIIGPDGVKDGIPQFDEESVLFLGWHEFSHSFINPLTTKNTAEINKYSALYEPIKEKMANQAYGDWETCVNEHIVRAVVARLNYIKYGEDAYQKVINNEKSNGFFYIEPICKKLELYEKNRDKYKTFEDFYPEIIAAIKELSESDLGSDFYKIKFNGPINAALSMNNPMVFIIPTGEADVNIQQKISDYVSSVKNGFRTFKDAKIITDKEALDKDLEGYNIYAYGTMKGNLWLAKYSDRFPFKIYDDRITLDKDYISKSQRLISAFTNPQNSDNALVIYTAQRAEDIVGINDVFHGPTDYIIADGKKEITSGSYIKREGNWSFK